MKKTAFLLAFLAWVTMSWVWAQAQSAAPPYTVQPPIELFDEIGEDPRSIAFGDIDGNGVLDMVVGNQTDVTVLLGDGSGGFSPAAGSPFDVGNGVQSVALGDIDGDGNLDVVTANWGSSDVTVLLGDGSGGFTPAADSPLDIDFQPLSVALGDINDNGNLDMVTANSGSDDITVLLGDGSGGFTPAAGSPFDVGDSPASVALGDIDGDGNLDVVTANGFSNDVSVLLGDGSGGFTAAAGSPFDVGLFPQSIALGDVNSDGNLDVVTANQNSGDVSVLLGDGSGGLTAASGSPFNIAGIGPRSVALGDVSGDGNLDLVTANSFVFGSVSVLLGDGSGGFTPTVGSPFDVGRFPRSIALGDVNDDGNLDVVTANEASNDVSVLLGDGSGAFSPAADSPVVFGTDPVAVAVGDLDGDGVPDAVVAQASRNSVLPLRGRDNGRFTVFNAPIPIAGVRPSAVALGDIDGDGNLDVVTANRDSNDVSVLIGDGSGGFTVAAGSPFDVGQSPQSVALGDVNGDGNLDVVTANFLFGNLSVLLGDGSGGFTPASGSPFDLDGSNPRSVSLGDVDGDGNLDVVTANQVSGDITVLLGDGSGGFTPAADSPFDVGNNPVSVALGDINGDGNLDVVVANVTSGDVSVLIGDGSGGFTPAVSSPFTVDGYSPFSIALGDVDGDGALDIVTANRDPGGDVSVLLGDGSGGFTPATGSPFEIGDFPLSLALGDIDGDGLPDAVVVSDGPASGDEYLNVLTTDVLFADSSETRRVEQ